MQQLPLCVFGGSLKEAVAPDDTRAEAKNERTVFHSAIHDPTTPDDATPRYTIECAVSAEFDVETDKESRVKRFLEQVAFTYPDGSESTWWHGEPIKGYVPPAAASAKM